MTRRSETESSGEITRLAIDFGGTKTAISRIVGGRVEERRKIATDRQATPEQNLDLIFEQISSLRIGGSNEVIGVAVAGRVDSDGNWYAVNPATLKELDGYPLKRTLERRLGCNVNVMNDAVAAAWGEYLHYPEARSIDALMFVTVSTGVGAGLVLGGKPLESRHGLAGHLGFTSSPFATGICDSGRQATLESVASGAAIARDGSAVFGEELTAVDVYQRHLAGASEATDVIRLSARAVANAIADATSLLDLDCVILGGGVGLADGYIELVKEFLAAEPPLFRPDVRAAVLGYDSALYGVTSPVV